MSHSNRAKTSPASTTDARTCRDPRGRRPASYRRLSPSERTSAHADGRTPGWGESGSCRTVRMGVQRCTSGLPGRRVLFGRAGRCYRQLLVWGIATVPPATPAPLRLMVRRVGLYSAEPERCGTWRRSRSKGHAARIPLPAGTVLMGSSRRSSRIVRACGIGRTTHRLRLVAHCHVLRGLGIYLARSAPADADAGLSKILRRYVGAPQRHDHPWRSSFAIEVSYCRGATRFRPEPQ